MFLPFLLPGGTASAAAGAGLLASLFATLYAIRRHIPNPTEFWIIGIWFRLFGWHKHDSFQLLAEVASVKGVAGHSKVYIVLKAGRFDARSSVETAEGAGTVHNAVCEFYQNISLPVRQCDNKVTLEVWRKSHVRDALLGALDINVDEQIIARGFPKNVVWDSRLGDRKTIEVSMSLHKGAYRSKSGVNVAQQLTVLTGEPVDDEALAALGVADKVTLYLRLIEGRLRLLDDSDPRSPWRNCYFKAVKLRTDEPPPVWMLCWWPSKRAMTVKTDPIGAIPLLSVNAVLKSADPNQRHIFMLRYTSSASGSVRELYLMRVDRDRDLWVAGFQETIALIREQYSTYPRRNRPLIRHSQENAIERANQARRELITTPAKIKGRRLVVGAPQPEEAQPLLKEESSSVAVLINDDHLGEAPGRAADRRES